MSLEKVREHLKKYDLDSRIMLFDISSATVELAAIAVGTEPQRIAKTMAFCDKNGGCILIVTAGDTKIDNSLYKAYFGQKAKMMSHEEALDFTGHAVGGVCPFALPKDKDIRLILDVSLKRFDTVYPAAGTSNSAVKLSCDELEAACEGTEWAEVCKICETNA